MKKLLTLTLSVCILAFGCKKKDDGDLHSDDDMKNLHRATTVAADARAKFLQLAPGVNGDPKLALMQTLDWVLQQEDVSDAFHQDSTYLFIEMNSGLQTMFWFKELDAEGKSKYRGSGSGRLTALGASGDCANEVQNKKALIYSPGEDEFGYDFKSGVPEKLQGNDIITTVDFLKNEQANIAAISTFSNYGLVLMETHGTAISFMTGNKFSFGQENIPTDFNQFRTALTNQIGDTYVGYLVNGKLAIGSEVNYQPLDNNWWSSGQANFQSGTFNLWVTAKFLENGPSLSNTIVFGNFCFSGWITPVDGYPKPIGKAILDLNPITYYAYQQPNGYARPVDNIHSMALEDSTITGLLTDNDNTGTAHQKADGSQYQTTWPDLFLVHLAQPDWCYQSCGEEELTDSRDGEKYKIVTIGTQTWMADNLRYLPYVHTNSEFADAADNASNAYGVFGYNGTDVQAAKATAGYETYGVLYNWYAANDGVCPSGWHLPTETEWLQLANFTGLVSDAGKKLKSQSYWDAPSFSTNEYCFSAVPAGERGEVVGNFADRGLTGFHWTSTQVSTGIAKQAGFTSSANSFQAGNWGMGSGLACRCVKN